MKNILKAVKKGLLAAVTLSLLTASLVVGIQKAAASTPAVEFNYMAPNDYELLQVRKLGTSTWGDPSSVAPGDTVEYLVYYHNGGTNTAHNTTIKATLPSGVSNSLVTQSYIDSDETTPKYDTTYGVGGAIYGLSGGTVNVSGSPSKLQLVAHSGIWYNQDAQGNLVAHKDSLNQFPNGQHTSDIFANGLNLGDVNGCWQYSGFVYFQAKVVSGTSSQYVHKWGAVLGSANWSEDFTTQPDNKLAYMINFNNTGTITSTDVKVVDTLPAFVTYVPGKTYFRTKNAQDQDVNTPVADTSITFNGSDMTVPFSVVNGTGDVAPGDRNSFFLVFEVKLDGPGSFQVGENLVINSAKITSANGVNAPTNDVIARVIKSPTPTIDFLVDKRVDNASVGGASDPWLDQTTAAPGDTLSYKIDVINQGNTDATNVLITDVLPNYVTYVPGSTKLYYTGNTSGTALPDGITVAGVNIDVPAASQNMRVIVFRAVISTTIPAGTNTLVNTGIVPANATNTPAWTMAQDTATVDVFANRGLTITKEAGTSQSGTFAETVVVEEGDTVYFKINVYNNGNSTLDNVMVYDVLPNYLTYVSGSTTVDDIAQANNHIVNQASPLILTDLAPGQGKIIKFRATVAACPPLGTNTVVNTAYTYATGVTKISDTASVEFTVTRPVTP